MQTSGFWTGRRICVTGGAGFLGSYVVEQLRQRGAEDIFIPRQKDYDLLDPTATQRMLEDSSPQVIIHLAGRPGGVGANSAHPAEFFYENLMMGTVLIHAAWKRGVEKMVTIGTICAYPKDTPVPFREEALWNGYPAEATAPYGLAKKMHLVQSQAYRQEYGFNAIFLLPGNMYGPRDHFDSQASNVIPALIRRFLEAQASGENEVVVWGDGSATREFLFAEDAARGIVLAAERYDGSEPVNLGSGSETSIKTLAETIARLTGFEGRLVWDTSKPNGQPRVGLDVSRAEQSFGFRAQVPLEEGLCRTIAWYRDTIARSQKTL